MFTPSPNAEMNIEEVVEYHHEGIIGITMTNFNLVSTNPLMTKLDAQKATSNQEIETRVSQGSLANNTKPQKAKF